MDELAKLGLLEADGEGFVVEDVGRIAVVEALVGAGVPLGAWWKRPPPGSCRSRVSRGTSAGPRTQRPDVPGVVGGDRSAGNDRLHLVRDLGRYTAEPGDRIREDDERLFRALAPAYHTLGRNEQKFIEATRYFGDNARRTAEAQMSFYRRGILEPLLAEGRSLKEIVEIINPITNDVMRPGVRELLLWLNRRHIDALNMQMLVELVESALLDAGVQIKREERPPAIAFLDLTGFTRLNEDAGDERAVTLAARLSDVVRTAASQFGGNVVKLLGDGVMFHFPDPTDAVRCALYLLPEAAERKLPPARVGINAGAVVFRDGDYFGRTVNLAARITDYARPREVLVSQAVFDCVGDADDVVFTSIGPVSLKGILEPVVLHAARRAR